jgi:hypothetical protein
MMMVMGYVFQGRYEASAGGRKTSVEKEGLQNGHNNSRGFRKPKAH